ncbi:TPA: hypothetical protein DHT42_03170 [Candidatus Nomurabacteria bacterium]|nr:hypothetical protein [Candidatus Nomurabacteria bacterium]
MWNSMHSTNAPISNGFDVSVLFWLKNVIDSNIQVFPFPIWHLTPELTGFYEAQRSKNPVQ